MKNNYVYTKVHHFNFILRETKQLDLILENKLKNQFKLFDVEFRKVAQEYGIKNFIDFSYLKNKLIELNTLYSDFTINPIQINEDLIKNEIIHTKLLNKSYLSNCKIKSFFFNKTCINLGWFIIIDLKNNVTSESENIK